MLLKLAGALYLIWLAYQLWTAPANEIEIETNAFAPPNRAMLLRSFCISVLNPKGPIFYMAFVPQFVVPSEPILGQFAVLATTFLCIPALNSLMWLFFASALRPHLLRPRSLKVVNRTGAGCLFAAGLATAKASPSA